MTVLLAQKTDREIANWIRNHEAAGRTHVALYRDLLEERACRSQVTQRLDLEKSLQHLKQAAIDQTCTSYGALAMASGVEWSKARHQMNGVNGHLDRLLDICFARSLPLLTAICVNQQNVGDGTLGEEALAGFVACAKRLGMEIGDPLEFHASSKKACWEWGAHAALG